MEIEAKGQIVRTSESKSEEKTCLVKSQSERLVVEVRLGRVDGRKSEGRSVSSSRGRRRSDGRSVDGSSEDLSSRLGDRSEEGKEREEGGSDHGEGRSRAER